MSKKYLIRQSHYGYDDESYFPCARSMHSLYNIKADAQKKVKELNMVHKIRMPSDFGNTKAFTIIEVDHEPQFYVLWNPMEGIPVLRIEGEWGEFLIYGLTEDEAHRLAFRNDLNSTAIKGTLGEISKSPKVLKSFIESQEGISHKNNVLRMTQKHLRRLTPPVNALLKKPFYQIKKKSFSQLAALENEYNSADL